MYIKVEPADFFMFRVIMIYDLEYPDSEDQEVRDYLSENELEPRYLSTGEFDGRQCETMQFGGCYLGRHLDSISQIQRKAVEVELLTGEVESHLNASAGVAISFTEEDRRKAVAELVRSFHQESSFQTAENGELIAVLDGDAVREAALKLTACPPDRQIP